MRSTSAGIRIFRSSPIDRSMPSTSWRERAAVWVLAARPKTLWAAVAPVVLGTAMALEADALHVRSALAALVAAVLIQIGTNYSNDYHDFLKGADTAERKGPVRVTQAGLIEPDAVRRAALVAFGLAFLAGTYLIWRGGWVIFVIGVLSIFFGILYTAGRYSLAYLGLADLFVFVFFGPVAVAGTYFVQALEFAPDTVVAGLGPGFLSMAILLVNNVRDVNEDRAAGKKTLVVRAGRNFGVELYRACFLGAGAAALLVTTLNPGHWWALCALIVVPIGVMNTHKLRTSTEPAVLNPLLGATARMLIIYCLLFSIGWNL